LAKDRVIGVLGLDARPADFLDAFRETLRERGYLEARNVTFQERWADSHSARLDELAVDLVRLKVDVIIVDGTLAALTAKHHHCERGVQQSTAAALRSDDEISAAYDASPISKHKDFLIEFGV